MERFTTIYSLHNHPDKVKLAINQTVDEVAAKFVEIAKAYKSSVWLLLSRISFVHVSLLKLTDPNIRENCEKYGHLMAVYTLIFGISLPVVVDNQDKGLRECQECRILLECGRSVGG